MASGEEKSGRSPIAWIGDHLFGAILGAFVALGVGALFVTGTVTTRSVTTTAVTSKDVRAKVPRANRDSWPDGVTAWTVILGSEATPGLAWARLDQARRLPSRGLNLGVLRSDDYVGLEPGYWVAFAGQFDDVEEAQREADRYKALIEYPYQRFIEER